MTQRAVTLCPLISISGITGDIGKSLAVALHVIDLFAKWLASEVATLAGGFWSLWGRHQLLTATDQLSLPLGIHKSTMVREWCWSLAKDAQGWNDTETSWVSLCCSSTRPITLLWHDGSWKGSRASKEINLYFLHDRWEICPWFTNYNNSKMTVASFGYHITL